jgi:hypothetical protein
VPKGASCSEIPELTESNDPSAPFESVDFRRFKAVLEDEIKFDGGVALTTDAVGSPITPPTCGR